MEVIKLVLNSKPQWRLHAKGSSYIFKNKIQGFEYIRILQNPQYACLYSKQYPDWSLLYTYVISFIYLSGVICLTFIRNKLPDAAINGCDWWKWMHQLFHAVYLGGIWGIAVSLLLPICSITLMAAPRPIWHVVSIHTTIDATPTNCIYRWSERIKYEKPYHTSAKFADKNTIDMITKVEFASGTAWPVAINSTCVCNILYWNTIALNCPIWIQYA